MKAKTSIKRSYYRIWDEVPPQTNPKYEDQRHINRAHLMYRMFMAEILQVRNTDAILDRIRRNMYVTEDTLSEYIAEIPRVKEGTK